jgi:hypothetical protein
MVESNVISDTPTCFFLNPSFQSAFTHQHQRKTIIRTNAKTGQTGSAAMHIERYGKQHKPTRTFANFPAAPPDFPPPLATGRLALAPPALFPAFFEMAYYMQHAQRRKADKQTSKQNISTSCENSSIPSCGKRCTGLTIFFEAFVIQSWRVVYRRYGHRYSSRYG